MSLRPRRSRSGAAGFGLIELLIALMVVSLVLVAVFSTFFRSNRVGQTMATTVNLRQGARAADQLLERELRMAGSGFGRLEVDHYASASPTHTDSLFAINFGHGGGDCDSVTILGGWTTARKLSSSMANPYGSMGVDTTTGFSVGDLVVVTNGAHAHLFQVTAITSGTPGTLTLGTSSTWNAPSGTTLSNWPAGGYSSGCPVYRLSWVSYLMDSTSFRKPALVRREYGGTPQLVAYGIAGFQLRYQMQDGTVTRNPTDLTMVDEVIPMIWTRQAVAGRPTQIDSVWADVRPRTF